MRHGASGVEPVTELPAIQLALALTALHHIDPDILLTQHLAGCLDLHVGTGRQQAKRGDEARPG
jgi:hypothetical protein